MASKPIKLEDVKELHELVAASLEAIELGLKLLDRRVLMGGATVDLVALDAAGTLTLLAVGFQADDDMLLRALEGYSWCTENTDSLRRLYPNARLTGLPPRVLFIAEQVPEPFVRKIKHLRLSRADCLEYRFGLQFTHVAESRGAEVAAPPPAPPPSPPRVAPAPPRPEAAPRAPLETPTRRGRGESARREPPRPMPRPAAQAGRATGPAGGEMDEQKVRAVREYLQAEFPTAVIYDFFAHDQGVQVFHLQDNYGAVIHSAAVTEDLLAETPEAEIRAFLDKHRLAHVLRQAGSAGVSVAKAGLKIERR